MARSGKNGHKKLDVSTTDTTVFCFYDIDGNMLRKGKKKKVLGRTPYYVVSSYKVVRPSLFPVFLFFLTFSRKNKLKKEPNSVKVMCLPY